MYKFSLCTQLCIMCVVSAIVALEDDRMERLESSFNCAYDEDCSENSFCVGNDEGSQGRCKCKANFVIVGRNRTFIHCLPIVEKVDSSCLHELQCQINMGLLATCRERDKTCQCSDGAHLATDNRCYKSKNIGELCENHYNCLLSDNKYGYCEDGRCVCGNKHHLTTDNRCIPSSLLGEGCASGESCLQSQSNCNGGICKCMAGYVESNNKSVCLQAANKVGDECTEMSQCSAYIKDSFCINGKCSCKINYHGYGNACVVNAKLGERCFYNKECILSAELEYTIYCNAGTCQCVKSPSDTNVYGCEIVNHSTIPLFSIKLLLILLISNLIKYYSLI